MHNQQGALSIQLENLGRAAIHSAVPPQNAVVLHPAVMKLVGVSSDGQSRLRHLHFHRPKFHFGMEARVRDLPCPARQGDHQIDVKVAKRLLADPVLYGEAVHAIAPSQNLASVPTAAATTPVERALTGAEGSLSSSPR